MRTIPTLIFAKRLPFHLAAAVCISFSVYGPAILSASTFAPSPDELNASRDRSPDAPLDLRRIEVQVDWTGRSFYAVDDKRYPVAAVSLDNAFTGNRWPGGTVYYQFDPAVSTNQRNIWRAAVASWSSVAALSFVESSGSGNYILVRTSTGNNSYVGMIGGAQEMNISDWFAHVINHEVGHALGLEHEQSRSDRDGYVVIYSANIEPGHTSNFDRHPTTVNYGVYDFDSIMHYSRLAFSSNGQNTIEPVPAYSSYLYTMGEGEYLSALDGSGMAQRYAPPATIQNDLFANRSTLPGILGSVSGSTVGAGKESGEPNHHGNAGGASVWYKWTSSTNGFVTFDTYGSDFDTLLAVYTGNTVSQLALIRSNDDTGGLQSRVAFWATVGTSYDIAIDGWSGASGAYHLTWGAPRKADFNGDIKSDLVWQNNANGQRIIWLMNGTTKTSAPALPTMPTQWQIAAAGDFNNDGQPDLVWQDTTTGERMIWLMDGTSRLSTVSLPTVSKTWEIAGTGDFNRDGKTDLVWQNNVTGQRNVWLMNGTNRLGDRILPTVATQWRIAGTGDFNTDGSTDLVWQHSGTGQRSIWLLDGTTRIGDRILPAAATPWQIAGTGDFNKDGLVDLVWQNTNTGQRSIWFMNGTTKVGSAVLPNVSTQWQIRNQ